MKRVQVLSIVVSMLVAVGAWLAAADAVPSFGVRLEAADKQIKDKKFDEAEKDLLALANEKAGNDRELFMVYRKLMGTRR